MRTFQKLALSFIVVLISLNAIAQNVVVTDDNSYSPDASAMLDVKSTSKGILVPRLTSTQKGNISSPANGLLIYQTNSVVGFYYYNGSSWVHLSSSLADADNDTKIQVEETVDEDIIHFDIAGTEKWVMTASRLESKNTGQSVFIGEGAGTNDDLSTNYSTFIGYRSGYLNTSGYSNTAFGNKSLYSNKANFGSTAIGYQAMYYADNRTSGRTSFNTAVGCEALQGSTTSANNTGTSNTAIGYRSLYSTTSGSGNTANGASTLNLNTTGSSNTALGANALNKKAPIPIKTERI